VTSPCPQKPPAIPLSTRTIQLNQQLNFCRHGHEVRHVTAQATLGHWILWGHYACPQCEQVALDALNEEPHEALIAGRRLPVEIR